MVGTSAAFKAAVKNGAHQLALLKFQNAAFMNEDIDCSSGGIQFIDRFNENEELTIGSTPSSSLNARLINNGEALDGFDFGEFTAMLGVAVEEKNYTRSGGLCEATYRGRRFVGQRTQPYLLENGVACPAQPRFQVHGLLIVDGLVFCFSRNGETYSFDYSTHSAMKNTWRAAQDAYTWGSAHGMSWGDFGLSGDTLNRVMRNKALAYSDERLGLAVDGTDIRAWRSDGVFVRYEMTQLGCFVADRPTHLDETVVDLESFDYMSRLDTKVRKLSPVQFPATHNDIVLSLCGSCGVSVDLSGLVNGGIVISEEPDFFFNATARDVIGYIAGASGKIAKFDRFGVLRFRLFQQTNTSLNNAQYSELSLSSYEVSPIDGVIVEKTFNNVASSGVMTLAAEDESGAEVRDTDLVVGSLNNAYVMSNPMMPQDTASADAVLDSLSSVESFTPIALEAYTDWTVSAGDVITVNRNGRNYQMPVYTATTQWDGGSVVTLENSGSETRPNDDRATREREAFEQSVGQSFGGMGGAMEDLENSFNSYCEANDQHLKDLDDGTVEMWTQIDQNSERIELTAGRVQLLDDRTVSMNTSILQNAESIAMTATMVTELQGVSSGLETKIYQNAEMIEATAQRTTSLETGLADANTRITQTADSIEAVAQQLTATDSKTETLESRITQTASMIESTVSRVTALEAGLNESNTRITQTASSIELTATQVIQLSDRTNTLESRITQTAGSIESVVSMTDSLSDRITGAETRIRQTAEQIELVAQKTRYIDQERVVTETRITQSADEIELRAKKNELVSLINISPESIKISADKIDIEGTVTVTQLHAVDAKIDNLTSGVTQANKINSRAVTVSTLTVASGIGTYTGSWARLSINGTNRIVFVGD